MAKIYAIQSPTLEIGRILKNRLSALRVKVIVILILYYTTFEGISNIYILVFKVIVYYTRFGCISNSNSNILIFKVTVLYYILTSCLPIIE